jgi:hypothetical protein
LCYAAADPGARGAPDPRNLLVNYTRASKYEARLSRALGIHQDPRNPDNLLVTLEYYPWLEDPELAAGSRRVLDSLGTHEIRRFKKPV